MAATANEPKSATAIVSGGMDSVVLAHMLAEMNALGRIVWFDYGQRHKREGEFAMQQAAYLGTPMIAIDLKSMTAHLKGSALTGDVEVPDGHYSDETMRRTIVPNRNAIMLNVAAAIGASYGDDAVATAVHAGDHAIYPDCRPEFIAWASRTIELGMQGMWPMRVWAPFIDISKADIVRIGNDMGVDFALTWSCYKGGRAHCGRCGTCVERAEAFALARVPDPTIYDDPAYWKTQSKLVGASGVGDVK